MMPAPMSQPIPAPGPHDLPLEPEQLVALAPHLLTPPLEQWEDGMVTSLPGFRGGFGGRRATLRLEWSGGRPGMRHRHLSVEVEGPTCGVTCSISTPAVFRSSPLTGDPEYDARYEISAVPAAIGPLVFGPEVRAQLKVARPGFLRVEDNHVLIANTSQPHPVDQVAAQLAVAAMILDRVPDAMRTVGGAAYAMGAPHPEVVQHARSTTRRRIILIVVLALVILGPLVLLGVIGGIFYLSSEPSAPATVERPRTRGPGPRASSPAAPPSPSKRARTNSPR
jgi:hypothetical protein